MLYTDVTGRETLHSDHCAQFSYTKSISTVLMLLRKAELLLHNRKHGTVFLSLAVGGYLAPSFALSVNLQDIH